MKFFKLIYWLIVLKDMEVMAFFQRQSLSIMSREGHVFLIISLITASQLLRKYLWSCFICTANIYNRYFRKTLHYNLFLPIETDNKMAAGHYKFLFHFAVPQNVPSSFKGSHGEVRYQVKAVADVPWGFDYTAKTSFSVNHLYDLNTIPLSRVII